eukprot:1941059-Rhodomonas_salina.3
MEQIQILTILTFERSRTRVAGTRLCSWTHSFRRSWPGGSFEQESSPTGPQLPGYTNCAILVCQCRTWGRKPRAHGISVGGTIC